MDRIEIDGRPYILASLTQRLVAQILDGLVYGAIVVVALILFRTVSGAWIGGIVSLLYLFFQDGLSRGQSYGKRVIGTAVIDERTGDWCTFTQSLLRNLSLSLLSIIDWIFIFGERRQRLGDKIARTVVVRLDSALDR